MGLFLCENEAVAPSPRRLFSSNLSRATTTPRHTHTHRRWGSARGEREREREKAERSEQRCDVLTSIGSVFFRLHLGLFNRVLFWSPRLDAPEEQRGARDDGGGTGGRRQRSRRLALSLFCRPRLLSAALHSHTHTQRSCPLRTLPSLSPPQTSTPDAPKPTPSTETQKKTVEQRGATPAPLALPNAPSRARPDPATTLALEDPS